MIKMRRAACLMAGAAGMYFFDPSMGKRRRAVAKDKCRSRLAERRRHMQQQAVYDEQKERGKLLQRAGAGRFHQRDDRSVADHLHQVLKRSEVPTKDVTVEVLDDKVRLRGQVRTVDDMTEVLAAVGAESGNRQVESFLHLPTEPAPNKQPARSAGAPTDN